MVRSVEAIHAIHSHHPRLHPLCRPSQRLPRLEKTGPRQNGPRQLGQPIHFVLLPLVLHVEVLVQNAVREREFLVDSLDGAFEGFGQLALGPLRLLGLQEIHQQQRHSVPAKKISKMVAGSSQVHITKLKINSGLWVRRRDLLRPKERHRSTELHIRHSIPRVQASCGHIADYLLNLHLVGTVPSRVQPPFAEPGAGEKPRPPGDYRYVKIPPQRRAESTGDPAMNQRQYPSTPLLGWVQKWPDVMVVPCVPVVLFRERAIIWVQQPQGLGICALVCLVQHLTAQRGVGLQGLGHLVGVTEVEILCKTQLVEHFHKASLLRMVHPQRSSGVEQGEELVLVHTEYWVVPNTTLVPMLRDQDQVMPGKELHEPDYAAGTRHLTHLSTNLFLLSHAFAIILLRKPLLPLLNHEPRLGRGLDLNLEDSIHLRHLTLARANQIEMRAVAQKPVLLEGRFEQGRPPDVTHC
mmetsp:Transcript_51412/g.135640  ORF Transcript_51412/g.135640 Transcript_51412/m.135640 type:complete len:465 (-) Transcript_51412:8-1402(-)